MIFLIRIRSLLIVSLIVLSFSFIYIGITGYDNPLQVVSEEDDNLLEEINEINQTKQVTGEPVKGINPMPKAEEFKAKNDFFAEFRIERDKGRDTQIEMLKDIVDNANSSTKMRDEAQKELLSISKSIALEIKIENLLKAKNYNDAIALIEKNKITIVIPEENLKNTDVTRIGDLVMRVTGCQLEDISLIPKSN